MKGKLGASVIIPPISRCCEALLGGIPPTPSPVQEKMTANSQCDNPTQQHVLRGPAGEVPRRALEMLQAKKVATNLIPNPKCIMKKCDGSSMLGFCEAHLRNPPKDQIQFSDTVSASPSIFFVPSKLKTEHQISNSMGAAFLLVSPLKLKCSRTVQLKTEKKLHQSIRHNNENLEVFFLKPDKVSSKGNFYAPDPTSARLENELDSVNIWKDTESFQKFSQKVDKDQLCICAETREGSHENDTIKKIISLTVLVPTILGLDLVPFSSTNTFKNEC